MSLVTRDVKLGASYAVPSPTHLSIADGIGFNEWKELLEKVMRMNNSSMWWIGDALAEGEKRFKLDYPEFFEQFSRSHPELALPARIAARVHPHSRRGDLDWAHHRAVAHLESAQQLSFLDEALAQGWNAKELEESVAQSAERPEKAPYFTVRAIGELRELCVEAAIRAGMEPADWAASVLERAAREVIALEAA